MIVHLVDIIDGANFNVKMCSTRAFTLLNDADEYADNRVEYFRSQLRASGETDETFIEAIHSEMHEVELDHKTF